RVVQRALYCPANSHPRRYSPDAAVRCAVTLSDPLERFLSHFRYCYQNRHFDEHPFRFFSAGIVGWTAFEVSHIAEWQGCSVVSTITPLAISLANWMAK